MISTILLAILEDLCSPDEVDQRLYYLLSNKDELDFKGIIGVLPEILERDAATFPAFGKSVNIKAEIISKSEGIFSGIEVATQVFKLIDPEIKLKLIKNDADFVSSGEKIMELEGRAVSILIGERPALNFIAHLSGVATKTSSFIEQFQNSKINSTILDTRKTIPSLRFLQKKAVADGGGTNHRIGLWDMAMLKDTHIDKSGSMQNLVNLIKSKFPDLPIEIEVRNLAEVKQALSLKPKRIMLDNMETQEAVISSNLINKQVEIEVSGNIDSNSIEKLKRIQPDYVSIGSKLTLETGFLDLSLRVLKSSEDN